MSKTPFEIRLEILDMAKGIVMEDYYANQMTFWKKYGTTQSGGSRYETGRGLPNAVAMLIVLQEQGVLSDEQLTAALAVVKAS